MGIKRTYRGLPEVNLASYDFYDLATGTGYKNFYGIDLNNLSGALIYGLTTQTPYGMTGTTGFANATADIDFNLNIEVPLSIEGDCLYVIPVWSSDSCAGEVTITFYKVTGGTEFLIGTTNQKAVTLNNSYYLIVGKYEMPLTILKKGDILRLNLRAPAVGVGKTLNFCHDPKNRDLGVCDISQLAINLPIKL